MSTPLMGKQVELNLSTYFSQDVEKDMEEEEEMEESDVNWFLYNSYIDFFTIGLWLKKTKWKKLLISAVVDGLN